MKKAIRTEIIIRASKEKVWQLLTDLEQYETWNPFIVTSRGRITAGAILENTMKNGEKLMVFRPKVLKVEPLRYFDWLGSLWIKGIFDGHHYFELEELDEATVKLIHGENFSGLLVGPILKQIEASTRAGFVALNEALRARAEA